MRVFQRLLALSLLAGLLLPAQASAAQGEPFEGELLVRRYSPEERTSRLEVVDIASGERRVLTDSSDSLGGPLAPDGRRLVSTPRGERVVVLDTVNAESRTVLEEPARYPAWSPDGARIAVRLPDRVPSGIYAIDARGGGEPQLLVTDSAVDADCQFLGGGTPRTEVAPSEWAPDGDELLVRTSLNCGSNLTLHGEQIANLATGEVRDVAEDVCITGAHWAPQSSHVAFVRGAYSGITLIRRDGSDRESLGDGDRPTFSPRGDRLAWVADGEVVTRLLDGEGENTELPGNWGAEVQGLSWSPDGRALAVLAAETKPVYTTGDEICLPYRSFLQPAHVTLAAVDSRPRRRLDLGVGVVNVRWLGPRVEPVAAEPRLPALDVARIGGADRFTTAAAVSAAAFPQGAPAAVLARGDDFPDALAGARVAAVRGGPLLLALPGELPPVTLEELRRLGVRTVTLLGGPAALGEPVVTALERAGIAVERIGGADRFETAALALEGGSRSHRALLVNGWSYADALAAAALSAAQDIPVLLTDPDALPRVTEKAIGSHVQEPLLVVGGTAVVSAETALNASRACSCAFTRLAGADRFETAVDVAAEMRVLEGTSEELLLVRGDGFADALAAGPLGGRRSAPVLFTAGPDVLGQTTATALSNRQPTLRRLRIVGGTAALSDRLLEEARTLAD